MKHSRYIEWAIYWIKQMGYGDQITARAIKEFLTSHGDGKLLTTTYIRQYLAAREKGEIERED